MTLKSNLLNVHHDFKWKRIHRKKCVNVILIETCKHKKEEKCVIWSKSKVVHKKAEKCDKKIIYGITPYVYAKKEYASQENVTLPLVVMVETLKRSN